MNQHPTAQRIEAIYQMVARQQRQTYDREALRERYPGLSLDYILSELRRLGHRPLVCGGRGRAEVWHRLAIDHLDAAFAERARG